MRSSRLYFREITGRGHMKDGLLDWFVHETGVKYISDLPNSRIYQRIYSALDKLSPDDYPVGEWVEAVGYILKQNRRSFSSAGDAYLFFQCELRKQGALDMGKIEHSDEH